MISKMTAEAITKQINAELYSSYLYLSMSAYATNVGLKGAAHWLFVQAQEEATHAMRFYNYLNDQGVHVALEAIKQPPVQFKSALDVFEAVLKHENHVTALIHGLVDIAAKAKDPATSVFLQWFVTEQVEEESNATDIIGKLKLAGDNGGGLFMIDKDLATRMFVPPPDLTLP
jgi:ferritin